MGAFFCDRTASSNCLYPPVDLLSRPRLSMAFDLTPGSDAIMGPKRQAKTLAMRSVSAGELGRSSIPGYTGHVRGRSAENVHGAFHGEASRLSETACSKRGVARSGADSERTR